MKSFTIKHLRPYTMKTMVYGFFVVSATIFTMTTALSVADFLKILFESPQTSAIPTNGNLVNLAIEKIYQWALGFGTKKAVLYVSLITFGLYALKNIFTYLSAIQISSIKAHVVRDIRDELWHKALNLPISFFARNKKGDILSHFSNDVTEYEENILSSIQLLFAAVISIVLYILMLFYISTRLTLFVLLTLPIIMFVISRLSHKLKRRSKVLQEKNSVLMSTLDETMSGLKIIKSYTAIDFSNKRFNEFNEDYSRMRIKMYRRIDMASPVSDFLSNGVVIGILLFGAYLVFGNNGLTPELYISYLMMFVLMIPPIKDLTTAISQIKKGKACAERLEEFLSEDEDLNEGREPFEGLKKGIEFKNVCFQYTSEGGMVLRNVSFSIPKGKTVALVGSSGSGKSTLANLLARFYTPTSGKILVDGMELEDLDRKQWRKKLGIVDQDTILFNDSVFNNIAFSNPQVNRGKVVKAAEMANAHSFIEEMPQGYETNLGDAGSRLSGGQRQRISIARAILNDPEILILDEATSALDTESEHLVQQALNNAMEEKTVMIIAHRLSTVMNADEILVLEKGEIKERGTHKSLIAEGGIYSDLIKNQELSNGRIPEGEK